MAALTASPAPRTRPSTKPRLPGWDADNSAASRAFGSRCFEEARSAILVVPSVIARVDSNVLINALHPEFAKIEASRERPIWWDRRLFGP